MTEDLSFKPDELPEDRSLIIVDDDRAFLQRMVRAMEQRGFLVRSAFTVSEGIDLVRQSPPAFAVIDLRLEDGNGLDVIAELTRVRPNARIIVLTGYGNIATAVTAVKLGAVDYLAKPADADDVTDALLAPPNSKAPPPENPMSADRVRWEHIQRVYELCNRNVSETAAGSTCTGARCSASWPSARRSKPGKTGGLNVLGLAAGPDGGILRGGQPQRRCAGEAQGEHLAPGSGQSGCRVRGAQDFGAITVGEYQAARLGQDFAREFRLHSKIEAVAVFGVLRPLLVAAEVGEAGLDFDDGQRAVPIEGRDVGPAAVGQRELADGGCAGVDQHA